MSVSAMSRDEVLIAPAGLRSFVLGLAGLLAVVLGGWLLLRSGSEQVTQLQIEGPLQRVSSGDVKRALDPLLQTHFLSLELDQARARLSALPWVSRARVERVWPGTLRVVVWEREPFARWNEDQVIDVDGEVFKPAPHEVPAGLVQLGGAPGSEREVMDGYRRLRDQLATTPFALLSLRQDARGEWTARTVGGVELRFGRGVPDDKLPMLLGAALAKLREQLLQVEHVDLRYTNGFAVGWRTEPVPSGSEKHG